MCRVIRVRRLRLTPYVLSKGNLHSDGVIVTARIFSHIQQQE